MEAIAAQHPAEARPCLLPLQCVVLSSLPPKHRPASKVVPSLRQRIAETLDHLGADPSIEDVARVLGVHVRTLQRRLRRRRITFRDLVSEAQRKRAILALESGASITEVAALVGFESIGGFYRAFRRWTDTTPAGWLRGQGRRYSTAPSPQPLVLDRTRSSR